MMELAEPAPSSFSVGNEGVCASEEVDQERFRLILKYVEDVSRTKLQKNSS